MPSGFTPFERINGRDNSSFAFSSAHPHVTVITYFIHKRGNLTGCDTVKNKTEVFLPARE